MKTGGTKTVYSWDNGKIVAAIEDAKTTVNKLENPLGETLFEFITKLTDLQMRSKDPSYGFFTKCKALALKITLTSEIQERLTLFAELTKELDEDVKLRGEQHYTVDLQRYIAEGIAGNEHRLDMHQRFPVTIKNDKVEMPNKVHFVWIGGEIPEIDLQNIKTIQKQNDKLTVYIHYDPNALLVGEVKKKVQTYVDNHLSVARNRIQEVVKLEMKLSDYYDEHGLNDDTRKRFMIEVLEADKTEVESNYGKIQQYWKDFGVNHPEVSLVSMEKLFDHSDLSQMKKGYEYELQHRSLAGASNVARFSILHTEGGLYADVGLVRENTSGSKDNILYDYMHNFPENGFALNQGVKILHDIYPYGINNNFLVSRPYSHLTGTLIQDMGATYEALGHDIEMLRMKYKNNMSYDQFRTSVLPLTRYYLENSERIFKKYGSQHFLQPKGSWKVSGNNPGAEYIIFITDTSKLTQKQKEEFIQDIKTNMDGYNNDTHKIVVLDSNAVIKPIGRDIIKQAAPFFTIQRLPSTGDEFPINYSTLFDNSKRIFIHDENHNFEKELFGNRRKVTHKKSRDFNKTVKTVTNSRYFQVFLFNDDTDFKKTIENLAPDISQENYVALTYDKTNEVYRVLNEHDFKVAADTPLRVNFIGDIEDLDEVSELKKRTESAKEVLQGKLDFDRVEEVKVVLSEDIKTNQDLLKIRSSLTNIKNIGFMVQPLVSIHARDVENKSNVALFIKNNRFFTTQGNQTLIWKNFSDSERHSLSNVDRDDSKSLNKYHNVIIQSYSAGDIDTLKLAEDTDFKGDVSIVQVWDDNLRTVYGQNLSSIKERVRIINNANNTSSAINNIGLISKKLHKDASISEINFFTQLPPKVENRESFLQGLAQVSHKFQDVAINAYSGVGTIQKKRIIHNYKFSTPVDMAKDPLSSSRPYNIIFPLHDNVAVDSVINTLVNEHPNVSYIARIEDENNKKVVKVYDLYGNNVNIKVDDDYHISVVDRDFLMADVEVDDISTGIQMLQKELKIDMTKKGVVVMVPCKQDNTPSVASGKINSLAKLVADRLYKDANIKPATTIGVEVEVRNLKIQSNEQGITTMSDEGGVITRLTEHMADPKPYKDQKLQDWDDLSNEQRQKLNAESQKAKPNLANHDHQIIVQAENDKNAKDAVSKLASKHPTQTTIIQIDKNG
ncbi:MAG: hypothetical protein FE834_05970, partial [Gammaproteobacteria bacterium]|nr:hypothetical protein [Gammaproteobacteria bacterium]